MATITVLSIDGGGIRGLIPAAFLDQLEQRTGRHVFELFDYVAGTSTGGILALGLGANRPAGQAPYTARELVGLYQTQGPRIFSRSFFHRLVSLGSFNGPKYPADGVEGVLRSYFGERRLKDARTNVLITAYALELHCPFFFRSWQASAAATARTHDFPIREVARCTSAAPTYFAPSRATAADGRSYALVDGGVYANNPALCAWVEAHDRHPGDEIVVVSLGTGNVNRPIPFERATNWGLAGWAPHVLDVIFDGVSDTVDVQLDEMLNPDGVRKYFRFQQDIPDAQQEMDETSPDNLAALRSIGEGLAEGRDFDAVCDLLEAVAAERIAPAA